MRTRKVLAPLCALLFAAGGLVIPASPAGAQGGPCYGLDASSQAYADLSGEWVGHSRKLTIYAPGCGYIDWRTYTPCPPALLASSSPACERAPNGTWERVGHTRFVLDGRIDETNVLGRYTPVYVVDADWLQGAFVLHLIEPGVLSIDAIGTFCNPEAAARMRCGA